MLPLPLPVLFLLLVMEVVKIDKNVLGIVVLIRVLLRAIAVGGIRDTRVKTAMLRAAQVLVVTSLRRTLGKSRRARVRKLFWILDLGNEFNDVERARFHPR